MRLLEARMYRGQQISVYIMHPGDLADSVCPVLRVEIDDESTPGCQLSAGGQLAEALEWGRDAVDRCLSALPGTYQTAG